MEIHAFCIAKPLRHRVGVKCYRVWVRVRLLRHQARLTARVRVTARITARVRVTARVTARVRVTVRVTARVKLKVKVRPLRYRFRSWR